METDLDNDLRTFGDDEWARGIIQCPQPKEIDPAC